MRRLQADTTAHLSSMKQMPGVKFCCAMLNLTQQFNPQHTRTAPPMYCGRRRSGGGSGTSGGGSKTSRGMGGASSSSPSSTTLPASTASLHHDKGSSRANGSCAAFSIRLQGKDILAELERSAGKSGGLVTSGRGREADYQVSHREADNHLRLLLS